MICSLTKKQILILCGLLIFALIIIGLGVGIYVSSEDFEESIDGLERSKYARLGGAVTNGEECAAVARTMLHKGGSVVDAGIATSICEGVAMAQSMGLGGGFFATIYKRNEGKVYTLNARETAPGAATKDMYYDNPDASKNGGLAVAVPGEIRGFQYLHQKFGVLQWRELFQPTIELCRSGFTVSDYLEGIYKNKREMLLASDGFRDFIDPNTGEPFKKGDKVKRLKLATTLEIIASEPDALHQGSLTKGFVKDIRDLNGIITEEDMNNYKPKWQPPLVVSLSSNHTLHTFPPPGSGVVLAHILALLSDNMELDDANKVVNWQRIIESFKFAYGMRTHLGDPDFVPEVAEIVEKLTSPVFISEIRRKMRDDYTSQDPAYYGANTSIPDDHGTAHINILAPNGDAFAMTGTINLVFGAGIMSPSTGIILNNEMDDFAGQQMNEFGLPSSPANFIAPGKRPLSSMCPSIILDGEGNVRMIFGGAGGTRITSSSALVALRHLWYNDPVKQAIAAQRMHHQLFPMEVSYDPNFSMELINGLREIGHVMTFVAPDGFGAVTALTNASGKVDMGYDPRRSGSFVYI